MVAKTAKPPTSDSNLLEASFRFFGSQRAMSTEWLFVVASRNVRGGVKSKTRERGFQEIGIPGWWFGRFGHRRSQRHGATDVWLLVCDHSALNDVIEQRQCGVTIPRVLKTVAKTSKPFGHTSCPRKRILQTSPPRATTMVKRFRSFCHEGGMFSEYPPPIRAAGGNR